MLTPLAGPRWQFRLILCPKYGVFYQFFKSTVIFVGPRTNHVDSSEDVAFVKILVFGSIFDFPEVNRAQK